MPGVAWPSDMWLSRIDDPVGSEVRRGTGNTFIFEVGERTPSETIDLLETRYIPQLNRIIDGRVGYLQSRGIG